MPNVTYLIGAGASANAIPIVSFINTRIEELVKKIRTYEQISHITDNRRNLLLPNTRKIDSTLLDEYFQSTIKEIIDDLEWLLSSARSHSTIDTLAKKFYLTGELSNLERLKKSLITFFTLEQYLFWPSIEDKEDGYLFKKTPIDKRYDSFIASVAKRSNDDLVLNGNIKMLSWNYDSQLELCLKKFLPQPNELNLIKRKFQIHPNFESYYKKSVALNFDKFALIKLNGTAVWEDVPNTPNDFPITIFDKQSAIDVQINLSETEYNFIKQLGVYVDNYRNAFWDFPHLKKLHPTHLLQFAWEHEVNEIPKYSGISDNLEDAIRIAEQTEILVVIGYSFPIFNRDIDKQLFDAMFKIDRSKRKLKKVYIQDLYPQKIESTMKNAFMIFQSYMPDETEIKFQHEDNLNQFVIPYEL